jgi:hypothetical protein
MTCSQSFPVLEVIQHPGNPWLVRLGDSNHQLRRCGRSHTDKGKAWRKATIRESRQAVASLEPLRRLPKGGKEVTISLPQFLARGLGSRVEQRSR